MDPKWTQNGPKMDLKWTQNGPQFGSTGGAFCRQWCACVRFDFEVVSKVWSDVVVDRDRQFAVDVILESPRQVSMCGFRGVRVRGGISLKASQIVASEESSWRHCQECGCTHWCTVVACIDVSSSPGAKLLDEDVPSSVPPTVPASSGVVREARGGHEVWWRWNLLEVLMMGSERGLLKLLLKWRVGWPHVARWKFKFWGTGKWWWLCQNGSWGSWSPDGFDTESLGGSEASGEVEPESVLEPEVADEGFRANFAAIRMAFQGLDAVEFLLLFNGLPRSWRKFHIFCEKHLGIVCNWPWKRLARRTTSDEREVGSCSCCCHGCSSTDNQEVATFHVTNCRTDSTRLVWGSGHRWSDRQSRARRSLPQLKRKGQHQRGDDVDKRVEKVQSFVLMGEMSSGRQGGRGSCAWGKGNVEFFGGCWT